MSNKVQDLVWNSVFGEKSWKTVACKLADHADEDGCGVWPSVERIAAQTELSLRTVQRALSGMVEAGILVVVREGGHGRFSTTRYDFNMSGLWALPEAEWPGKQPHQYLRRQKQGSAEGRDREAAQEPGSDAGATGTKQEPRSAEGATGTEIKGDTVSPLTPAKGDMVSSKGDMVSSLGCHGDTQTLIEPPVEPSLGARARDAEGEREPDRREVERGFKRFFPTWPTYVADSEPEARKAWHALTPQAREQAEARRDDYLAAEKAAGRTKHCSAAVYLREKRWEKLPEPKTDEAPPRPVRLAPFGKAWMAYRLWLLETFVERDRAPERRMALRLPAGGMVMLDPARDKSWKFPFVEALDQGRETLMGDDHEIPPCEHFTQVAVGTGEWRAWADWHAARDWPWIEPPAHVRFVWMPATLPPAHGSALAAPEMAEAE